MRKHISLATLLSALALFVSLSGTAVAAVIITSNSQVAAHTIAGAAAAAGKNENLIRGSVGGADLADGTVGYAKLKLPLINYSGQSNDADSNPHHKLLTIHSVSLWVTCETFTNSGLSFIYLYASSTADGNMRGVTSEGTGTVDESNLIAKHLSTTAVQLQSEIAANGDGRHYVVGTFTFYNLVRAITFNIAASITYNSTCDVHGTVLPAPN
jgi:hypothetical protein